jgi:signal transduction histidine kinase
MSSSQATPSNSSASPRPPADDWLVRWQRFSATAVRAFHAYGNWLVSITWLRFAVLAAALLIVIGVVHDMPPFTWSYQETLPPQPPRVVVIPPKPAPPPAPAPVKPPTKVDVPIKIDKPKPGEKTEGVQIQIGKDGIRISPRTAAPAASAASAAADGEVRIQIPGGADTEAVREAVAEAKEQVEAAVRQMREDAEEALRDAQKARDDAERALEDMTRDADKPRTRTHRIGIGDFMLQLTWLWVLASAVMKFTYKGRMQAEVKAAMATETAEAESLKRQVVEARMAAMQAQVEPHFLFNTLASIDHLIETDPPRASQMQKNLIALLRASMPTMRETASKANGVRDLGRELAVIRPYLEILKVRMEERLAFRIDVPEGLHSAEFPPMMIQTLVENAIKHGLEPKPEGGSLELKAQIVHGKLQVTVADTGLGFGRAATAGTGVGLAHIRERLQLLYGPKAALTVAENPVGGTVVTIVVPYKSIDSAAA